MIYRTATFEEHCATCGQPTQSRCIRCSDSCCDQHLYTDDEVCARCHDIYDEDLSRRVDPLLTNKIIAIVTGTGVVMSIAMNRHVLGLVLGSAVVLIWLPMRHYAERRRWRKFLARNSAGNNSASAVARLGESNDEQSNTVSR